MATGVTAELALSNFIQEQLECSICCHRFREPKLLQCAHTFCLKCLQELEQSQQPPQNNLVCPLCQEETILPEDGMDKLSNNYTLISLLDEVTKQEQRLEYEEEEILCQACNEEHVAISQCLDCEHYLCQNCEKAHKRMVNMTAHKLMALNKMEDNIPSKENSVEYIYMCQVHTNNQLCFYCNSCEQLICKQCTATIHKGFAHYVVNLSTVIDLNLQKARENMAQVRKCDVFKQSRTSINWASLRNRLNIMFAETKSQISKRADLDMVKLKQKEQQLLQQAELNFRSKDRKLAELILAEQTVKMVHRYKTDKDRFKLLKLRQELLHDYTNEVGEHLTQDTAFISFKECENEVELGTLLLKEKWEIMGELDSVKGKLIASFSTGDMVVVNSDNPQKLTKLSIIGKELNNIGDFEDPDVINQPTAIAVNKDDELIVLDSPEVKIFSQEYQLLHKFTAGGESAKGVPTCLAVDDSNMIAVGYENKEEISLHDYDGSLIKTLPAPMIANYMTISNQQCYYTNYDKDLFMCVDFQGNIIFKINAKCHGVCSDKSSVSYLHVCLIPGYTAAAAITKERSHIQRRTADGNLIGRITEDTDEAPILDVTYTPDGRIAVTGPNFTRLYHRV